MVSQKYEKADSGYQMLPDATNEMVTYDYMLIDSARVVASWINEDLFKATRDERVSNTHDILMRHRIIQPDCKSHDVLAAHVVEINDCKQMIVCDIVSGEMTVEEGIEKYKNEVGIFVEQVLASLNQ